MEERGNPRFKASGGRIHSYKVRENVEGILSMEYSRAGSPLWLVISRDRKGWRIKVHRCHISLFFLL
jgi:hypothetical protein